MHIRFEKSQRAISSGQTVAIYKWDELIGSGIIA
jgi:tRNA U34 2-thiouridine synthase MnmA/TrmU